MSTKTRARGEKMCLYDFSVEDDKIVVREQFSKRKIPDFEAAYILASIPEEEKEAIKENALKKSQ